MQCEVDTVEVLVHVPTGETEVGKQGSMSHPTGRVDISLSELSATNTSQPGEKRGDSGSENEPVSQEGRIQCGNGEENACHQEKIRRNLALAEKLLQWTAAMDKRALGVSRLVRRLRAERDFLAKLLSGSQPLLATHAVSTNLTHLHALLLAIQALPAPCSVLKSFRCQRPIETVGEESAGEDLGVCECQRAAICPVHPVVDEDGQAVQGSTLSLSDNSESDEDDFSSNFSDHNGGFEDLEETVVVDIVTNGGQVWVKIVARNPKSVEESCRGESAPGKRTLLLQCKALLHAAKANQHNFSPPIVCVLFTRGVTPLVKDALSHLGVLVGGRTIASGECSEDISCEDAILEAVTVIPAALPLKEDSKVNLDITALIVLVSELTHGSAHFDFHNKILNHQASEEQREPALPPLQNFLRGKTLVVCQTAVREFQSILSEIAGPREMERARLLLNSATVVDDCMSARVEHLEMSARIRSRSKVVFGTGDHLKLVTVSANMAFVRAAQSQGVNLNVFPHLARALSESKQAKATPLPS